METRIPVRLFAPPEFREGQADHEQEFRRRSAWITQVIMGSDAVKFYTDDDPIAALNGSREKLDRGQMVDVDAVLRVYARRNGVGVALERFEERAK